MEQPLDPDDPEFALLLAVITIAIRDLRRGPSRPHYGSALRFLRARGVLNDRNELDRMMPTLIELDAATGAECGRAGSTSVNRGILARICTPFNFAPGIRSSA
jgi:hypothetical protein